MAKQPSGAQQSHILATEKMGEMRQNKLAEGKKNTLIVTFLRITLSPLRSIIREENLQIKRNKCYCWIFPFSKKHQDPQYKNPWLFPPPPFILNFLLFHGLMIPSCDPHVLHLVAFTGPAPSFATAVLDWQTKSISLGVAGAATAQCEADVWCSASPPRCCRLSGLAPCWWG